MTLVRPEGSAVATGGFAAYLTWKQAELLLIVADGPKPLREIGEVVREIHAIDLAAGDRPMYWGTDDSALRSSLRSLERRNLVYLDAADVWRLTAKGREATEVVR